MEISYGSDYKFIPAISLDHGAEHELSADLFALTIQIVNIVFVGEHQEGKYVLVDAGMPHSANKIIEVAEKRFGEDNRPEAIILTHGHFDHVGSIIELIQHWDVPVYAHELELPYLTGQKSYPNPDPSVEGGLIAKMSPYFPKEPINLGKHIHSLPKDGSVPFMPGFRWIHTPGHSEGHISLFRDEDRFLIAGDAFVTVQQDALYKVFTQELEINGPPRYFTPDWITAWESVKKLAALKPEMAITGHGWPIKGEKLVKDLGNLAKTFDKVAIPDYGKYVN